MLFDLTGKTALITGGGGILGRRITKALVAHGAKVAVVDLDYDKAAAVSDELSLDEHSRIFPFAADVTSPNNVAQLKSLVTEQLGQIDVLLNNAAGKTANFFTPFEEFPLADWDQVMSINLTGVMLCCQAFGSEMAQRRSGSIINTLSVYGIVAPDQRIYEGSLYEGRPINTPAVYSASKAGVWGLTKYLASYWGSSGVRVNAVTPGGVFSGQNETFVARYSARVPLGRMADRDEMSGAMVFLASDASSYVTGQNIVVDGGLTVW